MGMGWAGQVFQVSVLFIPLSPFVSSNWKQTRGHVAERPLKLSAALYFPTQRTQDYQEKDPRFRAAGKTTHL